jgi:uncharacterized protein YycO
MGKKSLFIIMVILALLSLSSCSVVALKLGLKTTGYRWDTGELNRDYLLTDEEIESEFEWKAAICPEAFEMDWVTERINHWINHYDFDKVNFHNLPPIYRNLVFDKVYYDIDALMDEVESLYPTAEIFTIKSNMDLTRIRKGDIVLTRNSYFMSVLLFSRYSMHHALMAVSDPTSDTDSCFISSYPSAYGMEEYGVSLLSSKDLQMEEFIVVLRMAVEDSTVVDKAVDYALKQLGKPYNDNYILKSGEESFYCTQLIYRSYLSAGLNLDANHLDWDDHGLVLPDDIYKSPYLEVVKFGN